MDCDDAIRARRRDGKMKIITRNVRSLMILIYKLFSTKSKLRKKENVQYT